MNCFNHPAINAVGTCIDCQKGLCVNCASKFSIPLCSRCNMGRVKNEKALIINELGLTFLVGTVFVIFSVYIGYNMEETNGIKGFFVVSIAALMMFYSGASIIAGWKQLSAFTSKYFIALPVIGWVIYFFTKLGIGTMIGFFVLPIRLYKNFKRLNQLKIIENIIIS